MKRSWYPALSALIVALLLAGCSLNNTPQATPTPPLGATAAPATIAATPGAPEITETLPPAETSAATTVLTSTPSLSPGPIFQPGLLQAESIIVNATGEIQPATISATTGLTLAITLVNRNEADALLAFDLSPSGAATIHVPGTLTGTGQPPGQNPTATPLDQTPETSPTPTPRLLLPPTSAISATSAPETATPTPLIETPVISGSIQVIYLRYDQPGTYFIRCIADASGQAGGQSACSGSVTIIVTAPSASPTEVAPPPGTATGTPLSGTAVVTGTAALTSTSGTTTTSAPAGTDTPAPATTATTAATASTQATSAATTGPTTGP